MARIALSVLLLMVVSVSATPQPAVDAYKTLVHDRIGARWYSSVQPHRDQCAPGTIRVLLSIGSRGLISAKVLSNTSNKIFECVTLDAITAAKIPPAPSDALKHCKLELEVSFSMDPDKT